MRPTNNPPSPATPVDHHNVLEGGLLQLQCHRQGLDEGHQGGALALEGVALNDLGVGAGGWEMGGWRG